MSTLSSWARQLAKRRRLCYYSTDAGKKYTATMLLPKTDFPQWSEPAVREEPFRERTTSGLYKWQAENATGLLFVLHDGPPYANGHLHMGHALNKILKDVINRFQILQGLRVSFIPGWDCHGLPIENKALQELGTGHKSLDTSKLRKIAREVAVRDMNVQMEEFKQFGIMADWSEKGTYRTMDHDYEVRQLRVFQDLVRKGLIYRNYRPVHWSPSSKSALAEAELEYVDKHKSFPVYVKFPVNLESSSPAFQDALRKFEVSAGTPVQSVIWTTTPWTLPANLAIAVNPEMEYVLIRRDEHFDAEGVLLIARDRLEALQKPLGSFEEIGSISGGGLVGLSYSHMFHPKDAPEPRVVAWNMVSNDTGSGLVHLAPSHGVEDYNCLMAEGYLQQRNWVCPVDGDGRYSPDVLALARSGAIGERLVGKDVLNEGSREIVKILTEASVLIAQETIRHRYPYDWKTKQPIIVRATSQWFANVDEIKQSAIKALEDVNFYPAVSRSRLESFVRERSEWCISRQRSWGVPIPALYDAETDEAFLTVETLDHIIPVIEAKGTDHWFEGPVEDFIPPFLRDSGRKFVKGRDTVDVWFDSGTSWSMIREKFSLDGRECLSDVCLEGSDQHRGWFQSLLLTATGTAAGEVKSPYKNLITHGFVLDDKGRKMSKSEGNIISPLTIIHGGKDKKKEPAYGADVLRLWAASVEYNRDVSIGPKVLAQSAESLRKIRNTIRFLLANIRDGTAVDGGRVLKREDMSIADKYVMAQLYQLEQSCKEAYNTFNFPKVVASLNRFTTNTLSSFYFDITKDTLYADDVRDPGRKTVVTVLNEVLETIVPILAPIAPHLAEEAHHTLCQHDKSKTPLSVFSVGWKSVPEEWNDPAVLAQMESLFEVRSTVMNVLEEARKKKRIGGSVDAALLFEYTKEYSADSPVAWLRAEESFLKTLFVVSDVQLKESAVIDGEFRVSVVAPTHSKCPRCWQHTRPKEDELCGRCADVLSHSNSLPPR